MKNIANQLVIISILISTLFFVSCSGSSNQKTDTFTVNGNCGMCKDAIESALKNQKAITSGKWDEGTKKLTVTYNSNKITIEEIHQLVASAGFDTDKIIASDASYYSLPSCCQYDRMK